MCTLFGTVQSKKKTTKKVLFNLLCVLRFIQNTSSQVCGRFVFELQLQGYCKGCCILFSMSGLLSVLYVM